MMTSTLGGGGGGVVRSQNFNQVVEMFPENVVDGGGGTNRSKASNIFRPK